MKILQVVSSLSPQTGGPAKAVLELSDALKQAGQEVSIFATNHGYEANGNGRTGPKTEARLKLFRLAWPKKYFYSPDLEKELKEMVENFDLVHIHGLWLFPTFIASRICQKKRVPYLIRPCGMLDQYCLSHHRLRKKIYASFFEKENLDRASVIHFTTEEEKYRSKSYRLKPRAVVIPLGIDLTPYSNLPPKGSFRKNHPHLLDRKIILFLGRVNFKKGLELLTQSFSRLVHEGENIQLVIAGTDDEGYGVRVKRLVAEEKISDRVLWAGFIQGEEKLALLNDSDLLCLPSRQENFGLAVAEAMAAGLPVVVSDQVNIHKEIKQFQAGLVTSCDPATLHLALQQLLRDEALRKTMGENGKRLVQEKYQWDLVTPEVIRLYESIARRH